MTFQPRATIPVALCGATGNVGQRFVQGLARHPWFELAWLGASARSAGKPYGEAVSWGLEEDLPSEVAGLMLEDASEIPPCALVFSALDKSVAGEIERRLADAGRLVVTNASPHRMAPGVPLLVPEVNPDHLELFGPVREDRGAILANPNCSTIGLVLALKPIADAFGVHRVTVATCQALSGAGMGGPLGLEALDNVLPHIRGEEEKLESETQRILGRPEGANVLPHPMLVSAQCNRVPVQDGHLLSVSIELERPAEAEALRSAWDGFRALPQELQLPTAPERPTIYLEQEDAPQPRLHRMAGNGMSVTIGRLRPCPVLDWKFTALVHNTIRGAAGGAILAAELAVSQRTSPAFEG